MKSPIEAIEIEADVRYAQLIAEELDLKKAKIVETPRVKHPDKPLHVSDATLYCSFVMRACYLSQDRSDIQKATKNFAKHMQKPMDFDMRELRRLGRFLRRRPRAV